MKIPRYAIGNVCSYERAFVASPAGDGCYDPHVSFNVDGLNYCAHAHRVVREVGCPSCGAPKRGRCYTADGKALAPSRSHRPRLEAHARLST